MNPARHCVSGDGFFLSEVQRGRLDSFNRTGARSLGLDRWHEMKRFLFLMFALLPVVVRADCWLVAAPIQSASTATALANQKGNDLVANAMGPGGWGAAGGSCSYTIFSMLETNFVIRVNCTSPVSSAQVDTNYVYACDAECQWELHGGGGLSTEGTVRGTGTAPSGARCHPVSNCNVNVQGPIVSVGTSWIASFTVTNASCSTEDEIDGEEGGSCLNSGGNTVCASTEQTMVVNGDRVPPSPLADGECAVYSSGGSACVTEAGESATSPPAPDNGTPGTPATPVASVTNTTNNTTTNYYSQTATGGSSAPVSGEPGESVDGDGSPDGEGEGEGEEESLTGGAECAAPPVCTGSPVQCAQVMQVWYSRCPTPATEAEIESAVGVDDPLGIEEIDLEGMIGEAEGPLGIGAGACPTSPTITVAGHAISFIPIEWFCEYADLLSPFVLIFAYLQALFIVGRAVMS